MSLPPPRILAPTVISAAADVLEYEMLQEKAASLGRLTRIFETALAALAAFDAAAGEATPPGGPARREALVGAAGQALFDFVVQREACGLRNTEAVLREYGVPLAVRLRTGVTRRG